ncbi:MAG: hypothetical protein FJ279_29450 [Planctomycetes bacterium]|nr:hypothetical protein [Planctomycetota bacterium]MBM4084696.1 hypothetical protein [Planctomycetota bacterium]
MWRDPVVEEVREAGAKLAKECGYDLHAFFEMLRRHQAEANWSVVSAEGLKKRKAEKTHVADSGM